MWMRVLVHRVATSGYVVDGGEWPWVRDAGKESGLVMFTMGMQGREGSRPCGGRVHKRVADCD